MAEYVRSVCEVGEHYSERVLCKKPRLDYKINKEKRRQQQRKEQQHNQHSKATATYCRGYFRKIGALRFVVLLSPLFDRKGNLTATGNMDGVTGTTQSTATQVTVAVGKLEEKSETQV